jgi:hypothetical protein
VAFHSIVLRFALDLRPNFPTFTRFYLMIFAITGMHGGHAFAVNSAHGAL